MSNDIHIRLRRRYALPQRVFQAQERPCLVIPGSKQYATGSIELQAKVLDGIWLQSMRR